MFKHTLALTAAALFAVPTIAQEEAKYERLEMPKVMVGDPAPALTVGSWVKGDPVEKFESDRTYVVEFWATWCGPCRKSIPHLTELQRRFADRNVEIIGVSIWERDQGLVHPFVEEWGDKMGYTVAMDKVLGEGEDAAGQMAQGWMKAAGKGGIPTAFIVKNGTVNWIGYPMEMDEPLAKIVEGTWNLEEEAGKYRREFALQAKLAAFRLDAETALKAGKYEVALASMDEAIKSNPGHERMFGQQKFLALVRMSDLEQASAYGKHLIENVYHEDAGALNFVAWTIVDPEMKIDNRDYELSIKAAKRACELTDWKDPAILDTLALGLFNSGHITKALKIQEKAVIFAKGTQYEKELTDRLEKFRKAVQSQG